MKITENLNLKNNIWPYKTIIWKTRLPVGLFSSFGWTISTLLNLPRFYEISTTGNRRNDQQHMRTFKSRKKQNKSATRNFPDNETLLFNLNNRFFCLSMFLFVCLSRISMDLLQQAHCHSFVTKIQNPFLSLDIVFKVQFLIKFKI